MSPELSVLIPFFNHNKYIGDLLGGILHLEEHIKEIVILNDGSEQDPEQILRGISQGKSGVPIRYYKQSNQGISATLNRLIELSRGSLISVMASDDLFISDTIRDRIEFLRENRRYDAVIGDAVVIDEEGSTISTSAMSGMFNVDLETIKLGQEYAKKELIYRWGLPGPCLMIRKNVYQDIGKYDERYSVEDRDFYLRLFASKSVFFMSTPVAKYRVHVANTRTRPSVIGDLIRSNAKNARLYSGLERAYLSSYRADCKILGLMDSGRLTPSLGSKLLVPTLVLRAVLRRIWRARVWIKKACSRVLPRFRGHFH